MVIAAPATPFPATPRPSSGLPSSGRNKYHCRDTKGTVGGGQGNQRQFGYAFRATQTGRPQGRRPDFAPAPKIQVMGQSTSFASPPRVKEGQSDPNRKSSPQRFPHRASSASFRCRRPFCRLIKPARLEGAKSLKIAATRHFRTVVDTHRGATARKMHFKAFSPIGFATAPPRSRILAQVREQKQGWKRQVTPGASAG